MANFSDYNKGTKYLGAQNWEKAIQFLKRELRTNEFKECYLNLGNAYKAVGNWAKTFECYSKAASLAVPYASGKFGPYAMATSNLGLWHYAHGDDHTAMRLYNEALEMDPSLADAVWNYASAILRQLCSRRDVDARSAWDMYEFRFKRSSPVPLERSIPEWDGITKVDKIVVLAEQGLGDKLMFGRYVHCLREYANEVWVQCPDSLDCVFRDFKICRRASDVGGYGVPICSLARRFGHLDVRGDWIAGRFEPKEFGNGGFKVACEWAGSVTHTNNLNRSTTSNYFTDLASVSGVEMYHFGTEKKRGLVPLNTKGDGKKSAWQPTLEYLAGMDLVITIDSALAHAAACLGKEVWMIQPSIETDFRWGGPEMGEDNIWYPTLKVIRNDGNWDKIFEDLRERLAARATAHKFEPLYNALKEAA